jgi:hypothetical protein
MTTAIVVAMMGCDALEILAWQASLGGAANGDGQQLGIVTNNTRQVKSPALLFRPNPGTMLNKGCPPRPVSCQGR